MLKASINLIKNLRKQKRENSFLLFLDNYKIIKDAIAKGLTPKLILVDNEQLNIWGELYPIYLTDKKTIESLADSITPQGVLCIVEYIQDIVKIPKGNFLVLDHLQDPGNVGTLIRSALAFKFNDVYLLDSAKVTNPKVVRASAGAVFNINAYELSESNFIEMAEKYKLKLVKTDMDGENIFDTAINESVGIVIGNEGQGVSNEISKLCYKIVKIPMQNGIESLNAGISGSIVMAQITAKAGQI